MPDPSQGMRCLICPKKCGVCGASPWHASWGTATKPYGVLPEAPQHWCYLQVARARSPCSELYRAHSCLAAQVHQQQRAKPPAMPRRRREGRVEKKRKERMGGRRIKGRKEERRRAHLQTNRKEGRSRKRGARKKKRRQELTCLTSEWARSHRCAHKFDM